MTGKKNENTVLWWIGWITLTIVSFFAASAFWTPIVARHFGDMHRSGAPAVWVTAVFGTWMVLLVPLIILMYNKVDKAYEDARIARETKGFEQAKKAFRVPSIFVEESKRRLPDAIVKKLKTLPEAVKKGHLVTVRLKDGRRFENVFIMGKREILGLYDRADMPFEAAEVADVEAADLDRLPDFRSEKWLRLDGVGSGG